MRVEEVVGGETAVRCIIFEKNKIKREMTLK